MSFKKYLPIESYTLRSKLSIEEIKNRVSENVEPQKVFRFSFFKRDHTKPYQGQISSDSFQISRIIEYKNSFLPVITGQISEDLGYTLIRVKMRPVILVIVFMCFWLGFVALIFLLMLLGELFHSEGVIEKNFLLGMFVVFFMFSFGWCLMYFGFKYESKISKQFLASLLEGQEEDNAKYT